MKHGFLFWVSLLFVSVVMASFTISSNCLAVSYSELSAYVNATADLYPDNVHYQIFRNKVNSADFVNNYPTTALDYDNVTISRENLSYQTITLKFYNATSYNINKAEMRFTGTQTIFNFNYSWSGNGSLTPITNSPFAARAWSTTADDYNNLRGMDYNIDDLTIFDLPLTYVGNQALQPQVEYLQFINTIDYGAYNGSLYTYYYQGDFYSNNEIKLGDVLPNDSYYFEIRIKDSNTEVVKGTSFVALNTSPYTFYNDGAIYINDNYEVYAIPRLLKYSTQYQLEIISYYGDGGNNLYEDIDWFIFLPQNAIISGDVITSLGSGDFTQQDNVNTIIGFLNDNGSPSGDLQAILDTSGNILSGDLFKDIKMPQIDGMNKRTLFDLLYAIAGTLGESGDAYFDFQLHGETPTRIYASQFKTPDGPLKTLISSFLVFLTFYFLLSQFRHTIEMLSTANVKGAIEYVDTSLDNMFYM